MRRAYLDNSATTRPCEAAIAAMERCLREGWYNPSAVYGPSVEVFKALREARGRLLNAAGGAGCDAVFTSGGTESNNLAVIGAVSRMRGRQLVAVSAVEHPSVRAAFDAFFEDRPDAEADFDIQIDPEKMGVGLILSRGGTGAKRELDCGAYQIIIFKDGEELGRSENYDQERGAWRW